jgi:hypothetical protein
MLNTPRDRDRALAGWSLIIAPALLVLANAIDPAQSDQAAARLPEIANHPTRYLVAAYLLLASAWAFVPGLVGLWRLFRGPRLTLGQVGAGLVLIGTITTVAFVGFGFYEYEASQPPHDPAQMAELVDRVEASAAAGPLVVVFLLGVVVGSLVLAWSFWRRRIVPVWSPAAILVGTILNFLADTAALSALAFAFQLVGFGWVGLRLLSMSGEEWGRLAGSEGAREEARASRSAVDELHVDLERAREGAER